MSQVSGVSFRVLREGSPVPSGEGVLHHYRLPLTMPQEQGESLNRK